MHRDLASDRLFDQRFLRPRTPHEHFFLEGITYPASRDRLVSFVTDSELDPDVLNLVRSLPDREYLDHDDVWRSMGEATRRLGLGRSDGEGRDDLGKEATGEQEGDIREP